MSTAGSDYGSLTDSTKHRNEISNSIKGGKYFTNLLNRNKKFSKETLLYIVNYTLFSFCRLSLYVFTAKGKTHLCDRLGVFKYVAGDGI